MEQAAFSPYPYYSWCGSWTDVGPRDRIVEISMRQVAHCLIYTSRAKANVRWLHHGIEDRFRVGAGTVRFCPADDDQHTLVGSCDAGHRFHTLLIPHGHLISVAEQEGLAAVPELQHSVSAQDAVLTSCMRTISNVHQHLDEASLERREAAALSLILRLLSKNGWKGPDSKNDRSVFPRRTLDGLVAYIDDHLEVAPSLQEMCMRVGMSPSHFGKKFRQSTGLSLHRFINHRRIRKSLRMLTADAAPLKSIGATLGFSSHSHFTRTFTELTGMTPEKYRKQFKRRGGHLVATLSPRSKPLQGFCRVPRLAPQQAPYRPTSGRRHLAPRGSPE